MKTYFKKIVVLCSFGGSQSVIVVVNYSVKLKQILKLSCH